MKDLYSITNLEITNNNNQISMKLSPVQRKEKITLNKNIHNAITEFNSKIYEIRRKKVEVNKIQNKSQGIFLLKDQI